MDAREKRKNYEILRSQLEIERASFLSHWRELGDYIFPRRPRFFTTDRNKGDRRNQKIIDSTETLAARTLRSGMMSGVTSPARPWFRLTTPDPILAEVEDVKEWLHVVGDRMSTVFLKSNLYNALPTVYGDIGVFATAAMLVEEDFENVIHCHVLPIGSYSIGVDENGRANVLFREFSMTVRQLVSKFGMKLPNGEMDWSNFSVAVQRYWQENQKDVWVDVCHVISPNDEYDPDKLSAAYKRFSSCYYEKGYSSASSSGYGGSENMGLLRESGYDYFPALCPRWETTGEDTYGTECPGMTALGDIKQLQIQEKRGSQALEKSINPPLVGPPELESKRVSSLPGDVTYSTDRDGQKGLRPLYQVEARLQELEAKQAQIRQRIQRAFYEDLFLMLAQSDRRQITAREIEERHEEKLLALGSVLEQLNQDLLDPLIDIAFNIMLQQGLIPPAPEELRGQRLKVEYISIMAQAQKLVGLAGIERFASFMGQVAQFRPQVLDKLNEDQLADVYGDMTSVPSGIIRSDEDVQALRQERAEAAKAEAMAERAPAAAATARSLSETKLDGNNALSKLLEAAQSGQLVQQ